MKRIIILLVISAYFTGCQRYSTPDGAIANLSKEIGAPDKVERMVSGSGSDKDASSFGIADFFKMSEKILAALGEDVFCGDSEEEVERRAYEDENSTFSSIEFTYDTDDSIFVCDGSSYKYIGIKTIEV